MRWQLAFLFLLLLLPAHALDVPQPQGFVNDHAQLLSPEERSALESRLQEIARNTSVEIAILTIPSLEDEDRDLYANRVFREWGIGQEKADNGVLILIARDERKMRIEVGYGLEPVITDTVSGLIIRNRMAPAFRQGEYSAGLHAMVDDLEGLARQEPAAVSQYQHNGLGVPPGQLAAALLLSSLYLCVIIATAWQPRRRRGRMKGYGFGTAVLIAFLIGATAGWLTLFLCFWILLLSLGGGFIFMPGGGLGGLGGGGFGGFGGGSSGGGGAGGDW